MSPRFPRRKTRAVLLKPPTVKLLPVITSRYATQNFLDATSKFQTQFAVLMHFAILAGKTGINSDLFTGTLQDRLDILNKFNGAPAIHDNLPQVVDAAWENKLGGK